MGNWDQAKGKQENTNHTTEKDYKKWWTNECKEVDKNNL